MLLDDHGLRPGAADDDIESRRFAVRRRILVVAKQRFARSGYEQVSLEQVAYDAELEWADFLLYFRDKGSLLSAVLDDAWEDLLPRLKDIASGSISAHNALLGIFTFMTNALHKDEDLIRLLLSEGRRPAPESGAVGFTDGYRRFMQICREQVLRGQRDGSFRPSYQAHVAASMLVGALEGMLRDRLVAEQERSLTPYTGTYLISTYDALVSSLKL